MSNVFFQSISSGLVPVKEIRRIPGIAGARDHVEVEVLEPTGGWCKGNRLFVLPACLVEVDADAPDMDQEWANYREDCAADAERARASFGGEYVALPHPGDAAVSEMNAIIMGIYE